MIHADDIYADVADVDSGIDAFEYLQSHNAGSARIIDVEAGTGVKWGLVELNFFFLRVHKATADEADSEITGKAVDGVGDFQGSESTYVVLP